MESLSSQPARAGLSRPGRKRWSALYSCRFQGEKVNSDLGLHCPFRHSCSPGICWRLRTLQSSARNEVPGKSSRCCAPTLPPFTALAWFPAPQPVLGLAPHPVEGWSCGIVNQSLVPAGHRLPPPAQQWSLLAHCSSQPWALQKLHFHPACWLTYSPFASVGNMFDLLEIHSSYLHGPQWSLQT